MCRNGALQLILNGACVACSASSTLGHDSARTAVELHQQQQLACMPLLLQHPASAARSSRGSSQHLLPHQAAQAGSRQQLLL
jgi:hypothetical protein